MTAMKWKELKMEQGKSFKLEVFELNEKNVMESIRAMKIARRMAQASVMKVGSRWEGRKEDVTCFGMTAQEMKTDMSDVRIIPHLTERITQNVDDYIIEACWKLDIDPDVLKNQLEEIHRLNGIIDRLLDLLDFYSNGKE